MRLRAIAFSLLASSIGLQAAPSSAVPWLSDVLNNTETAPQSSATSHVLPGLLSPEQADISSSFFAASDPTQLALAINALQPGLAPAAHDLVRRILLSEQPSPTSPDVLNAARIDYFMRIGALHEASALLELENAPPPAIFNRTFDVALLLGDVQPVCEQMLRDSILAPTKISRIFCLTQVDDWNSAAILTDAAIALGQLSTTESQLVLWYLDPDYFESGTNIERLDQITPLEFTMRSGAGIYDDLKLLPVAFSHTAFEQNLPWRDRIYAAERLVANYALPSNILFQIYSEAKPAASGGVWERVRAFQNLKAAKTSQEFETALKEAYQMFRAANLLHALAAYFDDDDSTVFSSKDSETILAKTSYFGNSVANKTMPRSDLSTFQTELLGGLSAQTTPPSDATQIISALSHLHPNEQDLEKIRAALITLRSNGFESEARNAAVQLMILAEE